MTALQPCPKCGCGFWGILLEKMPDDLRDLSDDLFACCLWHETGVKCSRDPRFLNDPEAEDGFDPVDSTELEDEVVEDC